MTDTTTTAEQLAAALTEELRIGVPGNSRPGALNMSLNSCSTALTNLVRHHIDPDANLDYASGGELSFTLPAFDNQDLEINNQDAWDTWIVHVVGTADHPTFGPIKTTTVDQLIDALEAVGPHLTARS